MAQILGTLVLWLYIAGAITTDAKPPLFDAYRRHIVLDPGHGGSDVGALGANGTAEKTLALDLAKLIAAELQRSYKVTLTRTDDYHVDLDKRTALANHLKADVFVSLHTGGSFVYGVAGPIVYYYQKASKTASTWGQSPALQNQNKDRPIPWDRLQEPYQEKSRVLARLIRSRLNTLTSITEPRILGAPLAVLQGAQMPAILIEVGYLTNPAEEKNLRNKAFLMNVAIEISKAIDQFLSEIDQVDNQ
jgi:N-acetylmuramoyl-L-alanine amidase